MAVTNPRNMVWRLVDETGHGADLVTFVLPEEFSDHEGELLLETDIIAHVNGDNEHLPTLDLTWSNDDFQLLITLVSKMLPDDSNESGEVTLDFSDPATIEIIHIIASARFSEPFDLTELDMGPNILTHHEDIEVGDLVTINSPTGYHLAVITDLDSVEALCIMLEEMTDTRRGLPIGIHDAARVSRKDLLPATFGNVHPGEDDLIH